MTDNAATAPMTSWDAPQIAELLLECGRIAWHYFRCPDFWQLKPDGTLVTPADLKIERLLKHYCDRPADQVYMLGEETVSSRSPEYIEQALRGRAWVVDPIDGTAPYAHGFSQWGISIGLMTDGRLQRGAIYLPACGEMFMHWDDRVVWAEGIQPVTVTAAAAIDFHEVTAAPRRLGSGDMLALSQRAARACRINTANPVQATGSAVAALMHLLLGRYQAYIAHVKLWDMAAGLPLLLDAGYEAMRITDRRRLTAEVSNEIYELGNRGAHPWELRGGCILAWPGNTDLIREKLEPGDLDVS